MEEVTLAVDESKEKTSAGGGVGPAFPLSNQEGLPDIIRAVTRFKGIVFK